MHAITRLVVIRRRTQFSAYRIDLYSRYIEKFNSGWGYGINLVSVFSRYYMSSFLYLARV